MSESGTNRAGTAGHLPSRSHAPCPVLARIRPGTGSLRDTCSCRAAVPPGSMEAATKALPGVKFSEVQKAKFNGQYAFEIRGKDKRGKIREVEVSTEGQILEIE